MSVFYSASTGGFYDDQIHKNIPADCVEISAERREDLLSQQSATCLICADENGLPIIAERIFDVDELMALVRDRRDKLLQASDHKMMADYPASEAERGAWAAYRQQLRDLPETITDPADVIWPEPPTGADA